MYPQCPRLYYHSNPEEQVDTFSSSGFSLPGSPADMIEPLTEEGNKPFLWGQSLFIIATLLSELPLYVSVGLNSKAIIIMILVFLEK